MIRVVPYVKGFTTTACCLVILLLCNLACRNDTAIQGFDLADPNDFGRYGSLEIPTTLVISFEDTVAATGQSPSLLLGSFDNVSSRILVKFDRPDVVDDVVGAAITLITRNLISRSDSKSSFAATVHRVTANWDELAVTDDSFQNAFDGTPIGTAEILSRKDEPSEGDSLSSEIVKMEFNAEGITAVRDWIDTTTVEDNFGVLIDFSEADFVKQFHSRSSFSPPRLEVCVQVSATERDTVFVGTEADAYLPRRLASPPAGPLYIDSVFGQQSVISFTFDPSLMPRETTINRATLELNIDAENSLLTDAGFVFQVDRLAREFQEPNSFRVDSTFAFIIGQTTQLSGPLSIPVRSLIQGWISERAENHGLIIRTATAGADISRLAFISSNIDSSLVPRLRLEFSVAPSAQGQQ